MRLKTRYEIGKIPHSEHPCPQAMRKDWMCLNGEWDFYKEKITGERAYEGKILVPFSPETLNSGIAEDFVLESGEKLVYTRKVELDKSLLRGCTLLRFGAVDSECEVFVNGQRAGGHKSGFTAFALDISKLIFEGENEIKVVCTTRGREITARAASKTTNGAVFGTRRRAVFGKPFGWKVCQKRISAI